MGCWSDLRSLSEPFILLLTIQTGLLAYSVYVHSPTLNEPGHLVAGLSYWKFGRFDVCSVNPPLVKLVAALPVIIAGYEEDWSGFYTGPGARPEMEMGEDFVAANGERSFFLFMIGRWACTPFSWLGGIVSYLWARDLYGRPAGVIACAIWCFEPNILAHASLMTLDHLATERLIARFHVGKGQSGMHVTKPSEPPVRSSASAMAPNGSPGKSASKDHVGFSIHNWANHCRNLARIIFQVGILDDDYFSLSMVYSRSNRGPLFLGSLHEKMLSLLVASAIRESDVTNHRSSHHRRVESPC